MQRFFSVFIIFGILILGGGYLWMQKSEEEANKRRDEDLSNAQRSFADKARAAVREADDQSYMRSIKGALAAYDEELKKRVYAKKPELRDPDAYKKSVEERFKKGELKEAQQKSMLEGFAIVREAHKTLMSGSWTPQITAAGKGDTRLDIYELKRIQDDEGHALLEGKFFFWGIDEGTRVNWGNMSLRIWKTEKEKVKEGREMVEKDVDKVLGKVDGEAQPHVIIQNGYKYVSEFPKNLSVGVVWLPLMPYEATSMDLEYGYVAKTPGGDFDSMLKWEKMKVQSGWKLKEGENWDADVIEATEDEIAGKPEGEAKPE